MFPAKNTIKTMGHHARKRDIFQPFVPNITCVISLVRVTFRGSKKEL